VDSIKSKSSLRNKSPAAAVGWGGCRQHVGVGASRSSAGRAGDHEKKLGKTFYTGGVSEQQPVGGEEHQQPGVPCGSGDGARGVRNNALSTSLLPMASEARLPKQEPLQGTGKPARAVEAARWWRGIHLRVGSRGVTPRVGWRSGLNRAPAGFSGDFFNAEM
jgi:hypothetical protein